MDDFVLATFRINFPEFASETDYPDATINFWAEVGDSLLNIRRWGDRRTFGLQLFVAHKIALAKQDKNNATGGGVPGTGTGLQSSQSAGPISESIDTQTGSMQNAGNWNLTTYGVQFFQLSELVGMGGFVV
jgi:hypothetical protein